MLKDGISQELAPLHHVHILHVLCELGDGHFSVNGGDAVTVERPPKLLIPLLAEPCALVFAAARHGNKGGRRCIVVKELLLELRRILVGLNFVRQSLRASETALIGVKRIELLHVENIIDRNLQDVSAGGLHFVIRVPDVRRLLHPACRQRPDFSRPARCVELIDEIAFALELKVDLEQAPTGCGRHFIKRVRLCHEV